MEQRQELEQMQRELSRIVRAARSAYLSERERELRRETDQEVRAALAETGMVMRRNGNGDGAMS